jgi:ubiquinone biosynthesis protein
MSLAILLAAQQKVPPFPSAAPFAVILIVLAVVSGRLLGIRVSWLRGFMAAFIGTIVGFADYFGQGIQSSATPDFGLTFGVPALLATMVVLVSFELVGRPGVVPTVPRGLAGWPHPIRAVRDRGGRARRYAQVLWIAARNGLNPYLRGRTRAGGPGQAHRLAASVRLALEESGGVFVKLGQVLSTRYDFLPPAFILELRGLQDAVPPVLFTALQPILTEQFAAGTEAVFSRFEHDSMAAASIAQAHLATLQTGERVVVKVERPHIIPLVERDLEIIQRLARSLAVRTEWARKAGIVDLADGFAAAVTEELDFRIEGGNLEAMRDAAARSGVRVPRVFREYSGSRVLVMEWLDGVKLRDGAKLLDELGIDRMHVARTLLLCVLRQIMIDGLFHADPHPGNVLILRDGTPALIDFGSIGRLDAAQQSALRRILIAFDRRDATQMRDALVEIADVPDSRRQEALERALSQFMARRLGPGLQPGAALFTDLMRLLIDYELSLPPHVSAVFRSLVTLEGTLALLAPGFQIMDESRKVAADLLGESLAPGSIEQALKDEVMTQFPILHRIPRRLDQLAATIEGGRLTVRISLFEGQQDQRLLGAIVGRAILAFVGGVLGIMAALLLGTSGGPPLAPLAPTISLLHALGYAGLFVSTVLLLRVIVAIARDRVA